MITKTEYVEDCMLKFNEIENLYRNQLQLLERHKDILEELVNKNVIYGVYSPNILLDKAVSSMISEAYIFHNVTQHITKEWCEICLTSRLENTMELSEYRKWYRVFLEKCYDEQIEYFKKHYIQIDTNKYQIHVPDGNKFRFILGQPIIELYRFLGYGRITCNKIPWINNSCTYLNLKLQITEDDILHIEII